MNEQHSPNTTETDETSYDHVLKYTGVFGGVQGLKLLVSVGRNKLTSMLIGPAGIGLIGAYNSISEFLVTAGNMGIPLNATRQMGELYEEGTAYQKAHRAMVIRTWVLWSAILSVLVCLLFSPVISYYFFDGDWQRWPEVMLVSAVAVGLIIAEGECSILKGLHEVRKVAAVEMLIAFSTLLCTIPLYYLMGLKGVIFGLIGSAVMSAVIHFFFSLPLIPYRVSPLSGRVFVEGLPLIKVGIPYVLAGVANACAMMAISAIILLNHTMVENGHYQAGWTIMYSYAGLVFVALEADYFPRLTSLSGSVKRMNSAINQQIDVCTLIITPLLIVLITCMPLVLTALYSKDFLVVTDMAMLAVFYPFLRSMSLPMGYSILAKGNSILFLVLEVCFDVVFVAFFWFGYNSYGLLGAGAALSLGALYDVVVYYICCRIRYDFALRSHTLCIFFSQLVCLVAAVGICFVFPTEEWLRYVTAGVIFLASAGLSLFWLRRSSDFLKRLMRRHQQ